MTKPDPLLTPVPDRPDVGDVEERSGCVGLLLGLAVAFAVFFASIALVVTAGAMAVRLWRVLT